MSKIKIKKTDTQVCLESDSWIQDIEESTTLWIASLSDGTKAFMDDDRPNLYHSAWVRLKEYCETNNLHVVKMQLKFRSHSEFVFDEDSEGYCFRKGVLGSFGSANQHFYLVGILKNGIVNMQKWSVPELILSETDERNPSDLSDCLILRTKSNG